MDDETLRVGSAEYFRERFAALEIKDPTINDPNEGTLIQPQERPLRPWSSEIEKAHFGFQGRDVPRNAIIAQNTMIYRSADFHMICFAHGPLEPVVKTLCYPDRIIANGDPYDACVAIHEVVSHRVV